MGRAEHLFRPILVETRAGGNKTDSLTSRRSLMMNLPDQKRALGAAVAAARAAGKIVRANLGSTKTISSSTQHDIKLELDVRCQKLIERSLRKAFPEVALVGEEGVAGDAEARQRWVVDPIDGT